MAALAALTGARRSELLRVETLDLTGQVPLIRDRKRSRSQHAFRRVPLSQKAGQVIDHWLRIHPGGRSLFCQTAIRRADPAEPVSRAEVHDHLK